MNFKTVSQFKKLTKTYVLATEKKGSFGFKTIRSTQYRPAMPFRNRNNYFRGSFQFSIVKIKKISPLKNLKFNNLGVSQSLKFRIWWKQSFQFLLS